MNQPAYKSASTHVLSDLANTFYNSGAILLSADVVPMRGLARLRRETLSGDRHLCTAVQATCDLKPLQLSLPHTHSTPELPQSHWQTWARAPPTQTTPLARCCTISPRGSRRYAVLFSTFCSSHHFLCYFSPKFGSHSSIRQLYSR